MLPLAAAPAVITIQPVSLDAWRWQIEAMGWTWRATSADRRVEVFTQAVKDTPAPQLWVRTERFDGQWQSQTARVAVDCTSGQVSVVEDQLYGGMNLSGEVRDGDRADWAPADPVLKPVLRSACGS
jgi:hypothetical protein